MGERGAEILRRADTQLAGAEAAPFTPEAWAAVRTSMSAYIRDLLLDSARVSKRLRNGESITSVDVHHAARQLATGTSDRQGRYAGVLGGLLAGASLGNLLNILTSGSQSQTVGIVVTALVLAIGTGLIVWDLSGRRR